MEVIEEKLNLSASVKLIYALKFLVELFTEAFN